MPPDPPPQPPDDDPTVDDRRQATRAEMRRYQLEMAAAHTENLRQTASMRWQLLRLANADRFAPFRIYLVNGWRFDVDRSENIECEIDAETFSVEDDDGAHIIAFAAVTHITIERPYFRGLRGTD